ncbi:MarR family winged helix-turn-helix transcriptional regulator [Glycomyces buryatensis]|nr:MarR family transcriptional regulator [Glycomyces buryatensis]
MACFALYSASRAVTGYYRPLLDRLGLTYPQLLVLMALWEEDGRSVSALGEALYLDSGTLSPMIKRLETAGLVERRRESDDERRVTVHLTEAGSALEGEGCAIPLTIADASNLSVEELFALRDKLNELTDSLHGRTETTT